MKSFWVAGLLVLAHLVMRGLGLGTHMSIIAGMPPADSSAVIAPAYLIVYLLAITAAPVLAIAGGIDLAERLHRRSRRR